MDLTGSSEDVAGDALDGGGHAGGHPADALQEALGGHREADDDGSFRVP